MAALELALVSAALGKAPRVFLQGEAAGLIALPVQGAADAARVAAGLPDLAAMLEEAAAMGILVTACQTGLLMAGRSAADIWPLAQIGGLVSFLSGQDGTPVVY